jgi:hypothetical protein
LIILIIAQNPSIILYNVDLEKKNGEFTYICVGRKKRERKMNGESNLISRRIPKKRPFIV